MSSSHESIKSARLSIRQDLEDRWVTNLNEDRKRFFLIASLLDPHTKFLASVTTNTLPHRGNARVTVFLQCKLKALTLTSRILRFHQPSTLSDILGRSTSMDVDVDSVEAELNAHTRVHQVPLDTL